MTHNFHLMNYTENYTDNWKINQITSYFAEEGPGRGSEDNKKECNVNGFDFSSFLAEFHNKGVAWLLCPLLL